jgi:hypothetical protein
MSRAPRCPVKYDQSHWVRIRRRFCSRGRDIIVDEGPDPEGYKPTETNSTRLHNCKIPSHDRQAASVEIPKWARLWAVVESRRNEATDVPTLLDCNLRDARQGSAALRGSGCIADDEYLPLIRYVQERANANSTGMSVLTRSMLNIGEGATPAVHSTVALSILVPATITPCSSTYSTLAPVMTVTPSFSSRLAPFLDRDSA